MPYETRKDWERYLTRELRTQFERIGEESVQLDVSHQNFETPDQQRAALFWLGEQREARETRANSTFWLMISTAFLAGLGVVLALVDLLTRRG